MELVDKKAVLNVVNELSFVGYLSADDIRDAVEWMPVIEERKKGEWIEDGYLNLPTVCPYCGNPGNVEWKYCPLCGCEIINKEEELHQ